MKCSLSEAQNRLPRRTNSQAAKSLHALLRYYPGYELAVNSPQQVKWVITSLCALAQDRPELFQKYLPEGCMSAVYLLAEEIPFIPRLSKELSLDGICLIIIHLASYCRFVGAINPESFA